MTTRDTMLTTYVEDDLADEIQQRANQDEVTVSTYIADVLSQHIREQAVEDTMHQTSAEQRVEELVAQARDELLATTEQMNELLAKTGVNTIATWELVKRDYSDGVRQHALSQGAQRLHGELDHLGVDVEQFHDTLHTVDETSQSETDKRMADTDSDTEPDSGWSFET
jgi:hypothetical protein